MQRCWGRGGGVIWGWGWVTQRGFSVSPAAGAAVHSGWMRVRGWPWWGSWAQPPPPPAPPAEPPHPQPPARSATSSLTSCKTWWTTSTTSTSNPRRTRGTAVTGRAAPATAGASTPGGQGGHPGTGGGGCGVPGGGGLPWVAVGRMGAQRWAPGRGRSPASQPFAVGREVLARLDDLDVPVAPHPIARARGQGGALGPGTDD